jgi:hypothetical protein
VWAVKQRTDTIHTIQSAAYCAALPATSSAGTPGPGTRAKGLVVMVALPCRSLLSPSTCDNLRYPSLTRDWWAYNRG